MGEREGPRRPSVTERIKVKLEMVVRAETLGEVEMVRKSLKQDLAELEATATPKIKP